VVKVVRVSIISLVRDISINNLPPPLKILRF
jgi:hypothetical protein